MLATDPGTAHIGFTVACPRFFPIFCEPIHRLLEVRNQKSEIRGQRRHARCLYVYTLVPKLLFGNLSFRNSVSRNGVSRSAFPNGVWERGCKNRGEYVGQSVRLADSTHPTVAGRVRRVFETHRGTSVNRCVS